VVKAAAVLQVARARVRNASYLAQNDVVLAQIERKQVRRSCVCVCGVCMYVCVCVCACVCVCCV